ncbi:MAG: terpenoid cyclase/protein prenyltransferase alpha-alpha toroid, partial [Prosthecobacter sp.]|nr:terpenoid cyclase/protein prenyltransferase alpha-alpha toroid [Prosthecobacter sp.]
YAIDRTYQRIADDGSLTKLDAPKVGDRVLVTLNFSTPVEARYLVIDDPLPANFEAVNPEFKTQAMAGAGLSNTWTSDYNEIRTDRALFFTNFAPARGKFSLQYLARVIAEGDTTAPPARIEAMYQPDKYGLSPTQRIRTLPSAGAKVAEK